MAAASVLSNGSKPISAKLSNGHSDFELNQVLDVRRSDKAFASGAHSLVQLPPGAVLAPIVGATSAPKRWSSVQVGPDKHIELNSDLVFCNHSCRPNVEFDMAKFQVRVASDRPLNVGDPLTFFYPSSEWEMSQPFDCNCGAEECLGLIQGAKDINEEILNRYWLNDHIREMLEQRNGQQNGTSV